jgi:cytochrome c biogenesis protein CcdA
VLVAIAAPFAIAGTHMGYGILQRLSDDGFRRWTRWIVTMLGVFYLVRGLLLLAGPW